MLQIRIPPGFLEIVEEAEDAGKFDTSMSTILLLLQKAAREGDVRQTHLLTVSLHAFLYYKGGSYALPTLTQAKPPDAPAQAAEAADGPTAGQRPPTAAPGQRPG